MAGEITITGVCSGSGTPGGNNKELQYNNAGIFGGCAQLFWDNVNNRLGLGDNTPAKQLSLTKCMELLACTGSGVGVIYKGANRFIHDFKHATASGNNLFVGLYSGNFTMSPAGGGSYLASQNTGLGSHTLESLTTGFDNLAIGSNCLRTATTAKENVGIGRDALKDETTGTANMAIGYQSLRYGAGSYYNVAVGVGAGKGMSGENKSYNVLIGYKAGYLLGTGGHRNICIGYKAGDNITSGERNIVIGYDLDVLSAPSDYQLNIASTIFGNLGATKRIGINTSTMNETLNVGGAIRLGTSALTNAGAIRWTGTDFEGYTGAAWASLTGGGGSSKWTDAGQYIRPNANANYRVLDTGTDLSTVTFSANTVFVLTPGSTYNIGSTLTISNDYVTILGHGAKILKTAHCSLKLSGNHCKLIGFEIDGGSHGDDNVYVTGSYNEINGITSHHATHISYVGVGIALTKEGTPTPSAKYNVVTDCVCYDNHMGIANWKGMYNTISNNYTYNSTADGYTCDGDAGTNEYAYGNIYIGNRSYNDAHGIGVDSAHYCTFTGNHIRGATTYGGITTWNIEGPCSYCTFVGNTLENNHLYGICLGDGAGGTTTHCKLSGNTYYNNGSGDWYVDPDCDYNVIMEDDIYVRNNKGLFHRNAANTAWLQTLHTDAWDGVTLGKAASVVVLGTDSATANPIAIRVNGVNTKYITAGAVDSGGAGYRVLRVTN